jgi:protein involved in polysaccharide export with SLBB domain
MAGRVPDIALRANDMLLIASVSDMQEDYNVTIFGSVGRPDTYPYAEGMTVEDLLVAAGGLLESASTANITVTRRMKNPKSMEVSEQLFESFTIDLNDKLTVDGQGFVLEPFDQVYVRRSPVYITKSSVAVHGEVAFAGNYPLSHRNMRISEVVAAAGGPNPGAFVEGAYLLRRMTAEEQQQNQALSTLLYKQANSEDDSMVLEGVSVQNVYPVGIDLAAALANPGSDADVVLRDGDVISIPQYNATVRVMGAVMYPNSVTFQDGKNLKYYVKSAGGFDNRARKNRAFVIKMNGMVESGKSATVTPGSIVIIPTKAKSDPVNWSDVIGVVSSSASLAAVTVSAIRLSK